MLFASTLAALGLLGGLNPIGTVYPVGPYYPRGVVAADVNGDGKLDLVVARDLGGVSVLLGDGTGGFATPQKYAVGGTSTVAVGDINGDGNPDIVAGNGKVLLNNGRGGFTSGVKYNAGGGDSFLNLSDVNGDGKLDIITSSAVQLGNGDGTFGPTLAITSSAVEVTAVGDINRDGKLDVVGFDPTAVAAGWYSAYWLPGNGDGSFGNPRSISGFGAGADSGPPPMALADLDGNGVLDVAAMSYSVSNSGISVPIGLALNDGAGTFNTDVPYAYLDFGMGTVLAAADFNHDGKTDLVATGLVGGPTGGQWQKLELSLALSEGNGTFSIQTIQTNFLFDATVPPGGLAVGDFNGDGLPDVAVVGHVYRFGHCAAVFLSGP
jgi:hypothetical protein